MISATARIRVSYLPRRKADGLQSAPIQGCTTAQIPCAPQLGKHVSGMGNTALLGAYHPRDQRHRGVLVNPRHRDRLPAHDRPARSGAGQRSWTHLPRQRRHKPIVTWIVTKDRTDIRKTVELRGFEPLTFCMPYKSLPYRDGAECGSTSNFGRPMWLTVARDRHLLAPRFAPLVVCQSVDGSVTSGDVT